MEPASSESSKKGAISIIIDIRAKGFVYLMRVDNEILDEQFQQHKRPYIIGRTTSEGEWLLSRRIPAVANHEINER